MLIQPSRDRRWRVWLQKACALPYNHTPLQGLCFREIGISLEAGILTSNFSTRSQSSVDEDSRANTAGQYLRNYHHIASTLRQSIEPGCSAYATREGRAQWQPRGFIYTDTKYGGKGCTLGNRFSQWVITSTYTAEVAMLWTVCEGSQPRESGQWSGKTARRSYYSRFFEQRERVPVIHDFLRLTRNTVVTPRDFTSPPRRSMNAG